MVHLLSKRGKMKKEITTDQKQQEEVNKHYRPRGSQIQPPKQQPPKQQPPKQQPPKQQPSGGEKGKKKEVR